jgi:Bax protein
MQSFSFLHLPVALLLAGILSACAPKVAIHAPVEEVVETKPVVTVVPEKKVAPPPEVIDVRTRKMRFFAKLRPLVQAENKRIEELRARLLVLSRQTDTYNPEQMDLIYPLAAKYRVPLEGRPDPAFWELLLKRMDKVPVELALAQAANESAWGRSRFARNGHNYFGQWCYKKGCGIVPLRRNAGSSHEVKAFSSPAESVRAYIYNLNTTAAYKRLRDLRQHMRRRGAKLDAVLLAGGLSTYSERGAEYVKSIRTLIRRNQSLMRQ